MDNKRDKKIGLIVICALLIALMAGGTALYNALTDAMSDPLTVSESSGSAQENAQPAVTVIPQETAEAKADAQATPEVMGPMPLANLAKDFTVYTDGGEAVRLIEMRGKPMVVNFFASWCSPCKMEMPYFEEAYKAHGEEVGFMMVNLCAYGNDTKESAKRLVAEGGWTFPVYFDTEGSAATAYTVRSMPTTIFVSADGQLIDTHIGAMRAEQLEAKIDRLLAE